MFHVNHEISRLLSEKIKEFFFSTAVWLALLGLNEVIRFTLLGIFFSGSSIYQLTLKPPITTAADNSFDYYFICQKKQVLTFHVNCCQADISNVGKKVSGKKVSGKKVSEKKNPEKKYQEKK